MNGLSFLQFEVTRPVRGSDEPLVRTVIVAADPDRYDGGFWVAKAKVRRLFPRATEIRALGRTTRQVWEVAND